MKFKCMKGTKLKKIQSVVVSVNPENKSVSVYISEDLKTGFYGSVAFHEVRNTDLQNAIALQT